MTSQLALWSSEFGASYTDRNDRELPARALAWRSMVGGLQIKRVLEVGCNVGWNLHYLAAVGDYERYGVDPQAYATHRARLTRPDCNIVQGDAFDIPFKAGYFDLAFTCGVLIHIGPNDLPRALDEIYRVSRRYILYIEYDGAEETDLQYRGRKDALWKRDHRAIWQNQHPDLTVLRSGVWGADHAFDDCGWCLFEK